MTGLEGSLATAACGGKKFKTSFFVALFVLCEKYLLFKKIDKI